jgi:hypothetical protein
VNVTLRKKITLMALFSGAAFVIMAAIIRAVTILKVSRDPFLAHYSVQSSYAPVSSSPSILLTHFFLLCIPVRA